MSLPPATRALALAGRAAVLAGLLLLGACAEVGSRPDAVVTGTVLAATARDLPADARLRITLLAELAEGVLDPVAEVEVETARLPYDFTLAYDARAIDPARRHLVQAQVTGNGMLMLLTVDEHPVVTLGNPSTVTLTLAPAGG